LEYNVSEEKILAIYDVPSVNNETDSIVAGSVKMAIWNDYCRNEFSMWVSVYLAGGSLSE